MSAASPPSRNDPSSRAVVALTHPLAVAHRLREGDAVMRAGRLPGWSPTCMLGTDITGATLALSGFGRIARAVANRVKAFGMRIIHQRGTRSNDRRARPGRGAAIGYGGVAALDVYENEPDIAPGLAECPNVVFSPHRGSATHGMCAANAIAAASGRFHRTSNGAQPPMTGGAPDFAASVTEPPSSGCHRNTGGNRPRTRSPQAGNHSGGGWPRHWLVVTRPR
ncbi:NAD(P)-dependent oxidoreductase [Nonomuraea sp. NPDC049784]|uniref:NAD(P)-dependent oxidoreductase n=1 Tax=Nonomuraea sp. NPDC049784 TaxID=3154361 RepID=UPI003401921A